MRFRKLARAVWSLAGRMLKGLLAHRRVFQRVALLTPILLFLITAVWIVVDGLSDELQPADLGIVLSSRVLRSGKPAASLQARLDKAVELYDEGYFPQIMVSGGVGRSGYDEAVVMRDYLVWQGVPEGVIYIDSNGDNTYQTARNAAVFMKQNGLRRAMLVSQYFHLARAKLAARRFGIPVVYAVHADYWDARNDPWSMLREVLGVYVYLLRTYPD